MPKPAKKRAKDDDSDTSDSGPDDRLCNRSSDKLSDILLHFTSYLTYGS